MLTFFTIKNEHGKKKSPVIGRAPHFCVLPPGTLPEPHSEYRRKIPLTFPHGEGVGGSNHLDLWQSILSLLAGPDLRINYFISLMYLEEGKYLTPAHPRHPVPPKWGRGGWEALVTPTVQEHKFANRPRPSHVSSPH